MFPMGFFHSYIAFADLGGTTERERCLSSSENRARGAKGVKNLGLWVLWVLAFQSSSWMMKINEHRMLYVQHLETIKGIDSSNFFLD